MHHVIRKLALLAAATTTTVTTATTTTATATVLPTPATPAAQTTHAAPRQSSPAEFGIRFEPDGDPGQCGGHRGEQWNLTGDWSDEIVLDTDDRPGGCLLAFGIFDPQNDLADASVRYAFQSTPGTAPGQCGNQGDYRIPATPNFTFGPAIRIDTDSRPGGCTLTFLVSNTASVTLDIRYAGSGDVSQCGGALPNDLYTAYPGHPVPLTVDTDNRPGGCRLQLRLNL
ncbi:hypothetical protein ACFV0O_40760 [Kitasatospora sp. NPDC059577]|uniref:hypothetical protein n=1 Tax=Kitasatospora sp. NPDC059577 TaxID=3346873 RepID=UPI0036970945